MPEHATPIRVDTARPAPSSPGQLFVAFTLLAMQGFGGVIAVAQQELCVRRGWLTPAEFLTLLGNAQVLPGPNVCNLSLMVGDRFFGWRGAFAALAGMVALPLVALLAAAWLLSLTPSGSSAHRVIEGARWGVPAVAGGQVIGTVLKLAAPLKEHPLGWPAAMGLAAAAFVMMTWLRLPLVWVLLGLGLAACAWTYRHLRSERLGAAPDSPDSSGPVA